MAADDGTKDDGTKDESGGSEEYRRGLPGYHDPTAGVGGAAPALSALTLRLALAVFGLVVCTGLAVWAVLVDAPAGLVAVPAILALVALVDIVVILRRKRRGEPG